MAVKVVLAAELGNGVGGKLAVTARGFRRSGDNLELVVGFEERLEDNNRVLGRAEKKDRDVGFHAKGFFVGLSLPVGSAR